MEGIEITEGKSKKANPPTTYQNGANMNIDPEDYTSTKIKKKHLVALKLIGNGEINKGISKALITYSSVTDKSIEKKLNKIFNGSD